jgi:hypothetical protein
MDPHEFAQKQGQVAGTSGGDDEPYIGIDLLDLLHNVYLGSFLPGSPPQESWEHIERFIKIGCAYLKEHPVISTGVVDGQFSLVFQGGMAVPVVDTEPGKLPRPRPDSTIPITMPRETKGMRNMDVRDSSMPITTGNVGAQPRKAR